MYDFPWTAQALDEVWAFVAGRLRAKRVDAPDRLQRGQPLETQWRDPSLLLGQTCGYPYRHGLAGLVEILATPSFGFDGCEGTNHCSFLIVRGDDPRGDLAAFRGARAAINGRDSNTGMNLFRAALAPLAGGAPFFADVRVTGAHVASLAAVAVGDSDIAAIDCVTYGLVARHAPERAEGVRILARTPASPTLPFIASLALPETTRALVRETLFEALAARELEDARSTLGILGAEALGPEAYLRVDELERRAAEGGYLTLV
jgi:ABC-type phosphate/phosphonate transport system substrate-binding protein